MSTEADPIDVLVLSSYPPGVGGGEIQTREQLIRIARRGQIVHVIDLEPRHFGPSTENDEGVHVHRVRTPRTPLIRACAYHARIAFLAWRLGRRARIAQINNLGTGMISAVPVLAMLGVPRTVVVWGSAAPGVGPFGPGWRNRTARFLARRQTRVVSLSTATCRNLEAAGFAPDRIRFIPNGVDTERFRPAAAGDTPWRRSPDWPGSRPIVITVGRIVPEKAFDSLLLAWRSVAGAVPGAHLVIVGDGPLRSDCEMRVRELGLVNSVSMLGSRSDVPELLRNSDVYVSSSRSEGMSNALLEAMASGLPLVATQVGGAEDTVQDGVNGILVGAGDGAALAEALQEVLVDAEKRRAMGEASRRLALHEFKVEGIVDRYLDLFRQLDAPA